MISRKRSNCSATILSDNDVYKVCVEKKLKGVLRERTVSYFAKQNGSNNGADAQF